MYSFLAVYCTVCLKTEYVYINEEVSSFRRLFVEDSAVYCLNNKKESVRGKNS